MKILSTSDLHGNALSYYDKIYKKAILHGVDVVVNAGDMFPKTEPVFNKQKRFLKYLERYHFPKYEDAGIHYICTLGNDDLAIYDSDFDDLCSKYQFIHNIPQRKIEIGGYEFIGFNYVTDYPFGLKDRCRMDTKDFTFPVQLGRPSYSSEKGWKDIEDWEMEAGRLPTMEEELESLVKPADPRKAIYVMHMPPTAMNLDVCLNYDRPGSMAVWRFLDKMRPLLSIHGHFHESYDVKGVFKVEFGDTACIQAGQGGPDPVFCLIEIPDDAGQQVEAVRYHETEYLRVKGYDPENEGIEYIRISELPNNVARAFKNWLGNRRLQEYPGEKKGDAVQALALTMFGKKHGIRVEYERTKL